MAYLNLDDNYAEHPKIVELSDGAYRLHGSAMFYSAKWLLNGSLSPVQMRDRKGYKAATLKELIEAGLVHPKGGGCGTATCPVGIPGRFQLHDYLQWNKSREWWEARRKKDAERLAGWRRSHGPKGGE
jgi:hypothetical protein